MGKLHQSNDQFFKNMFSDQELPDQEYSVLAPEMLIQKYIKNLKKPVELLEIIECERSKKEEEGNHKKSFFFTFLTCSVKIKRNS